MIKGDQTRQRIYNYIVQYKQQYDGESPTTRQICTACNVRSTSHASKQIHALERLGMIKLFAKDGNYKTGIIVTGATWTPPTSAD